MGYIAWTALGVGLGYLLGGSDGDTNDLVLGGVIGLAFSIFAGWLFAIGIVALAAWADSDQVSYKKPKNRKNTRGF